MTPQHSPAKHAIEAAFKDLIGRDPAVAPETFIIFGKMAAAHELTQDTKNSLLYYAVITSATNRRIDDKVQEKLRDMAETMIELGADINYRPEKSRQNWRSPSLLDITHAAEDEKMRAILSSGKQVPHTGKFLDEQAARNISLPSSKSHGIGDIKGRLRRGDFDGPQSGRS